VQRPDHLDPCSPGGVGGEGEQLRGRGRPEHGVVGHGAKARSPILCAQPAHPSGELAGPHMSYSPCAGRASASACAPPSASWSAKSVVARMSARESAAGAATWCLLRELGCLGEVPGFATRLAVGCALIDESGGRTRRWFVKS
jgi:hypothetical protein